MNKTPAYSVTLTLRLHKDDNKVLSPALAELLTRIDCCASIRTAAIEMNIAYSNAWTMLRAGETSLGAPMIERTVGGPRGGGSVLTREGRDLLLRYQLLTQKTEAYAAALLAELFPAEGDATQTL
ncbi:MAG: LysR family transcriptional regulator [Ruthenibacterium sp.]